MTKLKKLARQLLLSSRASSQSERRPGTHSHREVLWAQAGTTDVPRHCYLWLWVPAFAGTTAEDEAARRDDGGG
ncbi:hypothetical protein BRAS3843_560050 [Bradyrhizobium sp. STM 3843]|nr:hypothetical protein BRAS3843_560050 [Bradyrhizobium sp. STM 3843]